jgi:hypothetical protein
MTATSKEIERFFDTGHDAPLPLVARRDRRARRPEYQAPFTPDRPWLADGGRSAPAVIVFARPGPPETSSGGTRTAKGSTAVARWPAPQNLVQS